MKIFLLINMSFVFLVCSSCQKQNDGDCGGPQSDIFRNYDDSYPKVEDSLGYLRLVDLPSQINYLNNIGITNTLVRSELKSGEITSTINRTTTKEKCNNYHSTYNKVFPFLEVNLTSSSSLYFNHRYAIKGYSTIHKYQNIGPDFKIDEYAQIMTISLFSPFFVYEYLLPLGAFKNKLPNYSYHDSLIVSGKVLKDVYHVYSDSTYFLPSKVVPQGIYYNFDAGLLGYYLSNGELWIKQ
jgi:hypothetical protein